MRRRAARSASFVATSPPSPAVVTFVGLMLKTSAVAGAADGPAAPARAERVGGVVDERDAGVVGDLLQRLDLAGRAVDVRRRHGDGACALDLLRGVDRVERQVLPADLGPDRGAPRPVHGVGAGREGEARHDDRAPRAHACRTSMSPAVQLDTATTCGTSSRSAARSSSSATVWPLVSIPLSRIAVMRAVRPGMSGMVGRTSGRPSGKAGWPPRTAGICVLGHADRTDLSTVRRGFGELAWRPSPRRTTAAGPAGRARRGRPARAGA